MFPTVLGSLCGPENGFPLSLLPAGGQRLPSDGKRCKATNYLPGPSKVSHRCLQLFSFWKNTEKKKLPNRVNSLVRKL